MNTNLVISFTNRQKEGAGSVMDNKDKQQAGAFSGDGFAPAENSGVGDWEARTASAYGMRRDKRP